MNRVVAEIASGRCLQAANFLDLGKNCPPEGDLWEKSIVRFTQNQPKSCKEQVLADGKVLRLHWNTDR